MILKLQKSTQKCSHIYCHNLCLTVARCVSQLSVIGTCPAAARSQIKLKLWVAKRQVDTYRQVGTYKGRAEMQAQQSKHLDLGIEVKWQVISKKFLPPNSNKALLCKYSYLREILGLMLKQLKSEEKYSTVLTISTCMYTIMLYLCMI